MSRSWACGRSVSITDRRYGTQGAKHTTWAKSAACGLLAVQHINDRTTEISQDAASFPDDFSLSYFIGDTSGIASTAMAKANDMTTRLRTHIIVGPIESDESGAVALVAGITQTPVISFGATAPGLSDKLTYPFLSRTTISGAAIAEVIVKTCLQLGWKTIATIHQDDLVTTVTSPRCLSLFPHLQALVPPLLEGPSTANFFEVNLGIFRVCSLLKTEFPFPSLSELAFGLVVQWGSGLAKAVLSAAGLYGLRIVPTQKFAAGNQKSIFDAVQAVQTQGTRIVLVLARDQSLEHVAFAAEELGIIDRGWGEGVFDSCVCILLVISVLCTVCCVPWAWFHHLWDCDVPPMALVAHVLECFRELRARSSHDSRW